MNIKKIWLIAILFGLTTSIFIYVLHFPQTPKQNITENDNIPVEEEKVPDEQIEENNLVSPLNITTGKRAISIPVNEVQGVSGYLKPGAIVDVITIYPPTTQNQATNQIILENIKVLAVGNNINTENQEIAYRTVTLEVLPEQGATLAYAIETGSTTLMLQPLKTEETD